MVYIPARREVVFLVVLPVPLSRRLAEKEKQVPRNSKEKAEFNADREASKKLIGRVGDAAEPFDGRGSMASLRSVDANLATGLHTQLGLFNAAMPSRENGEIVEQGESMTKGYGLAVKAMTEADRPDDPYMLGMDIKTGIKFAITTARKVSTPQVGCPDCRPVFVNR